MYRFVRASWPSLCVWRPLDVCLTWPPQRLYFPLCEVPQSAAISGFIFLQRRNTATSISTLGRKAEIVLSDELF